MDSDQPTLTIIDRTSGDTFELFGTGEDGPMEANEASGVLSGNFGCNELSIEVTFEDINDPASGNGGALTGRPESMEGTEEFCATPDGSDQLALTERSLLELFSGDRVEFFQLGDGLEIGNRQTNAVFERISAIPE